MGLPAAPSAFNQSSSAFQCSLYIFRFAQDFAGVFLRYFLSKSNLKMTHSELLIPRSGLYRDRVEVT